MNIKKVYTENPFVDSLMYCVQTLAYGSIIKISDLADKAETENSLKQSDLYMVALENQAIFDIFTYTKTLLEKSSVPKSNIPDYVKDKYLIPEEYRDEVLALAVADCIASYNEENEYYRMICGLPALSDYGIPIKSYEYLIPEGNEVNVTYVHQLGADGARMLELYGILDIIKADYPDAKYLNYITAGISIYKARKAINFQILYMPTTSILEIDSKFASKYELNRSFVLTTIYSDAFKISSDYYDNFIAILIILLTMADMLTEVQEHIVKKDILDSRCIEYIFSIYGIPYYRSIPLKYQAAMCRNVNSLIKYKSCETGMLNLISLFGMNDIEMFKYFILRDRKVDKWGDFIYNTKTTITSKVNDIVAHLVDHKIIEAENTIPFPFDYYLEKGNEMFVWLDEYRLREGVDYEVYNYDKISFKNGIEVGKTNIRYDFYYDKTTVNQEANTDTENGITMVTDLFLNTTGTNVISITPPYSGYFSDGNCMIVMIGGVFIDSNAYDLDLVNNTITINGGYDTLNRQITFVYLYGKKLITYFKVNRAKATVDDQSVFTIPEPFSNYTSNSNDFFVTIGSTYIDPRRYTLNGNTITFNDLTVSKDREVSFNFIYSKSSVRTVTGFQRSNITVTATEDNQTSFDITFPLEGYLAAGYKVYVKIKGSFLPEEYFDVYRNTLTLKDTTISLDAGEKLYVYFACSGISKNVVVLRDYRIAESSLQTTFNITYPVTNFFEKGNNVIIDTQGAILTEGVDFSFSSDKSSFTILNSKYYPMGGTHINYTFVYNVVNEYAIKTVQQVITVETDGQKEFRLKYPFYPYTETTQGFLVLHNTLMVHPDRIANSKFSCIIDLDDTKQGDEIVILYIFNNKYLIDRDGLLIVEEKTVTTNLTIDDDLIVSIPVPFEDYIENSWDFFTDSSRSRIDSERYDAIGNGLLFLNPSDILQYPSLTFVFVYKESYLTRIEEEDYGKDIDLKFVKIPVSAKTNTTHLKKLTNMKSYDSMTLSDQFWDGEDNQDNAHEVIKAAILKKEFNYARTKYMTVEYLVKLTDMSFEISYFYNMLYDDVFKEELLTVNIPTISPSKQFKLSHIFCYMTALAYLYSGIDDRIMDTPTKVLYVKGFNFTTDLAALRQYVLDERRPLKDFDVFGFRSPSGQIPSIDEFVNIYRTNKDVYKTICYNMVEARNYDIYKIWKKLYDSLMIWQFNLKFFKMNNGTTATTFSKFLQEKDNVLYTSLKTITAMQDQETRENAIITMISDIVYILDEYIDTDEFKYIYNQFPGVSKQSILQYLFTMINFFKSYKIVLKQMTVQFVLDDKNQNSIKIHDTQKMQIHLEKPDYITLTEDKKSVISLEKDETISLREKLNRSYYWLP